jgi:hypothetical protein
MCYRGIRSDNYVEILHHSRTIHERVGSRIKIISQTLDHKSAIFRLHLDQILILHETDQPNAVDCRERREARERNGALKVDEFVALPANAGSETFGCRFVPPIS